MLAWIASSTSQFASTFGIPVSGTGSVLEWVMSQVMTVIGLAFALVQALLPVIIGITVIYAIVKLIPRVLRFLHILS